jgi:hypothetical protein
MRRLPWAIVAISSCFALPAYAQVASPPRVTCIPINAQLSNINIANIEQDAQFHLTWSVTLPTAFGTSYQYELTYDTNPSVSTTMPIDVKLDTNANNNFGMNPYQIMGLTARYDFIIRASQIPRLAEQPDPSICSGPNMRPNIDTTTSSGACASMPVAGIQRSIVIQVEAAGNPTAPSTSAFCNWTFTLFTRRPPAPTITQALAGNQDVHLAWNIPLTEQGNITNYDVMLCPDATLGLKTSSVSTSSTGLMILPRLPCTNPSTAASGLANTQNTVSISGNGLQIGVPAAVALRSRDRAGNIGLVGNVVVFTPVPTYDFWDIYKMQGGSESGGFCFVATAAYGSYAHPVVWVLRAFRDLVLKKTPIGTALVWTYYHLSPPLADGVRHDPSLAAWTRVALLPIAGAAFLWMLLPAGGIFVALYLLRRKRRASSLIAVLLVGLSASEARAEYAQVLVRPRSSIESFGMGFEFKGGQYTPALVNDTSNTSFNHIYICQGAAATSCGTDWRPLFQVGLDFELYRGIGTAGVGTSIGALQYIGKNKNTDGSRSGDTTAFNQLPITVQAFYRFDWLSDNTVLPFVPYVKGGLAYHFWWTTTNLGSIARYNGAVGRGGKIGVTGTVGMAILLNSFDPQSALRLFELTSIRGTYIFGELQASQVNNFGGKGFDLSDVPTWNVGIYLEF